MKRSLIGLALAALATSAVGQEPLDAAPARFYAKRWGQPAWVFMDGISLQGDSLLAGFARAREEGLDSADYLGPDVVSRLHRHLSEADAWVLDSLLTRSFLLYARDVSRGRIDPAVAEQIALNLERWRWLPRALGDRYILVNSAAFTLELVNHDSVIWRTRGDDALRRALKHGRLVGGRSRDQHPRVDGLHAVREREQRVHIELGDLGVIDREL